MDEQNRIKVDIDGITFNIVGEEDESYMKYIANYIDKAISEILKTNQKLSRYEGVILLSLNLKDQIEKQKEKFHEYKESLVDNENALRMKEIASLKQENADLQKILKDKDSVISNYKRNEEASAKKIKEENKKLQDAQAVLDSKIESLNKHEEIVRDLEHKLSIQERLNFNRNKEILDLKNSIRALKEEIKRLEK